MGVEGFSCTQWATALPSVSVSSPVHICTRSSPFPGLGETQVVSFADISHYVHVYVYIHTCMCVYIYMHIHVCIYNIPIMLGYCIPRNLPIESLILDSREAVIRSTRDAAGKRCAGIVWRETIKTCEDHPNHQWIGLMENLQENPIFNGKIYGFL